jgi:hypothetical protein
MRLRLVLASAFMLEASGFVAEADYASGDQRHNWCSFLKRKPTNIWA